MYLKHLRINGFKSFADTTRITLEPGVTTVVGPNGCGKSNIADAIRWVLGEQRAKSLRAGLMQDVIFQGTDSRKPVNLCEVALLFSDCESELGTAYREVEITRRVSRDGASDYLLNGKVCRLKDIQGLFMDTGIGRVSYSFMVQGQIDQILSTNPAERRTIFEEAAGISKYKAQRREALNKLNLVDTNLARVTDVMEEVSRQIGSLRRQAAKALRYQRISDRLTHLDLAWSSFKFGRQRAALESLRNEVESLRGKSRILAGALRSREEDLNRRRDERSELYTTLREAQQRVFDLRSEKEQAVNQSEFHLLRCKDLQQRVESLTVEVTQLRGQQEALREQVTGGRQHEASQRSLVDRSDERLQEQTSTLDLLQDQMMTTVSDLQRLKQKILVAESGVSRLRSDCTAIEVELKTDSLRQAGIRDEMQVARQEGAELKKGLRAVRHLLEERARERERLEGEIKPLQEELDLRGGEFRNQQLEIQNLDREVAQNMAQLRILEELERKFEGFSDGAKAILGGELKEVIQDDTFQLLTGSLRIERGYMNAMIGLLGPAVDAIVLRDPETVISVTEQLELRKLGRACLQFAAPERGIEGEGDLPEWLHRAEDVVGTKDEKIEGHLRNLLSGCYFCQTLDQFLRFWWENEGFEFHFVATKSGELVDRRGVVYGGRGTGESESYLQRQEEIKRLEDRIGEGEGRLRDLREEASRQLERIDGIERDLEERRRATLELAQEISTAKGQESAISENLEQSARRLQRAEDEIASLQEGREDSRTSLHRVGEELKSAEAELESYREAVANREAEIDAIREERDSKRQEVSDFRLDLAEKRQRLETIERSLGDTSRQAADLEQLILRRSQEQDTLHEQIAELTQEAEQQRQSGVEIAKTLKIAQSALEGHRESLIVAENEIRSLEESLSAQREEQRSAEAELNQNEVQWTKERSELSFLADEVLREYQVELKSVDWEEEIWLAGDRIHDRVKLEGEGEFGLEFPEKVDRGRPSEDDLSRIRVTDWMEVAQEVKALRERIASMGPVNLIAIEEYAELNERHQFLKSQSDDLWESKDQLLSAIDEINRTSQQLFKETFDQVRKNLSFTFQSLFGGGSSDLRLIESEDVLESGIEIIARPPGTRLRSLALLSGGQKTMTAVALLFAIYMVKPSPFCLLDELDAPLDDANIGRFVKMLKQFTKFSQFVIITHNKRTIASSNSIFGVTMQEKGVSKMVSMQFSRTADDTEELESRPVPTVA